ncbi:DUF2789 family protein [Limnohabitans sp.]
MNEALFWTAAQAGFLKASLTLDARWVPGV